MKGNEKEWACDGQTGMDFDSVGAVQVPGNDELLSFSVTMLTVMCHVETSIFELQSWELSL